MKKYALASMVGVASALSNFLLFVFAYNKIATPFLHEEQRMENADFIMSYVVGGYLAIAVASTVMIFLLCKKCITKVQMDAEKRAA
jgi:predicted histidine transporter YuiF (NhaC family)